MVVYARPFLFVSLATFREYFLRYRHVGHLLVVHGGLPDGLPLVPDVVEQKKTYISELLSLLLIYN